MKNPNWSRDEIILALDLYYRDDIGAISDKNPEVVEVSKILNSLPNIDYNLVNEKYRNPKGVSMKLSNFKAIDPSYKGKGMDRGSKLDEIVFWEFYNNRQLLRKLANDIRTIVGDAKMSAKVASVEDDEISDNDSVQEGQVLYKLHKVREREKKIVAKKKKKVLKDKGKLECEACGFDFVKKYGKLGEGFIECHHIVPLAEFENSKETMLSDLALVCSNCHRMLHRDMTVLSISDFKNKCSL